jgi:hypothetical protein
MKSFKGGKKPANQGSAGKAFVQKPKMSNLPSGVSKPAKAMIKFAATPSGTRGSRNK